MKTRQTSPEALFTLLPSLPLIGVALTLGLAACAGDDESAAGTPSSQSPSQAPSSLSPAPQPNAPNAPANSTDAPAPSEPPVTSGAPAGAPAEEQPVIDLAMPAAGSGDSMPTTPPAGNDGNITEPVPGPGGLLPAVPSAGCGGARTLQDGTQTITSGGLNRTYFLETPDAYDSTHPYRVVFMFHWNYGSINAIVNPPDADRNTDRPFYGLGDLTDDQTIFVVPQGLVNAGGGAGWANPNGRDVTFTDELLAAVSADLCIDTSRVFTTGFSYGAGMSVALACVRPDKFRAAVVYSPAFISAVTPAQCTTPIALFQAHGVDDQVLNYQTGLNVLGTFTALNGCTAATPPQPPAAGHTCTSYEGCSMPTRFCSFGAGENNPFNPSLRGHYPTPKDPGQSASWVPEEAWRFISQF